MIEVEPRGPLYAVQWPEGSAAQRKAKDELEAIGVQLRLYDSVVELKAEPYPDGSTWQWRSAHPVGCYRSAEVHDWIVVFEAPISADSGQVQTYPAALFAVLFDEVHDTTPCTEEIWSWTYFTAEQVDPYWIRCTAVGPHDEHEDSNTGAKWKDTP